MHTTHTHHKKQCYTCISPPDIESTVTFTTLANHIINCHHCCYLVAYLDRVTAFEVPQCKRVKLISSYMLCRHVKYLGIYAAYMSLVPEVLHHSTSNLVMQLKYAPKQCPVYTWDGTIMLCYEIHNSKSPCQVCSVS